MARKRYTPQEKVDIVLRGLSSDISVKELCKEVGIQPKSYYDWKSLFMQSGIQSFDKKKSSKDAEKESLEKENKRLKEVVAELSLENHILKKTTFKRVS